MKRKYYLIYIGLEKLKRWIYQQRFLGVNKIQFGEFKQGRNLWNFQKGQRDRIVGYSVGIILIYIMRVILVKIFLLFIFDLDFVICISDVSQVLDFSSFDFEIFIVVDIFISNFVKMILCLFIFLYCLFLNRRFGWICLIGVYRMYQQFRYNEVERVIFYCYSGIKGLLCFLIQEG